MAAKIIKETSSNISATLIDEVLKKNNLLEIDELLKNNISSQISKVQGIEILESKLRGILEKWYRKIFFRKNNLSFLDPAILIQIQNNICLSIQAKYQKEQRTVLDYITPFDNQLIGGQEEGLWESTISPENKFQAGVQNWFRKGSGQRITCTLCNGHGRVTDNCPKCNGTGEIKRADRAVGMSGGKMGGAVIMREEQCLYCKASGRVVIQCQRCNGRQELYKYQEIKSTISVEDYMIYITPNEKIKIKWFNNTKSNYSLHYDDIINGQGEQKFENENRKYKFENYNICFVPVSIIKYQIKNVNGEIYLINDKPHAQSLIKILDKKKIAFMSMGGLVVSIIVILCGYYFFK